MRQVVDLKVFISTRESTCDECGEQWEFVYDPATGEGVLRGSDVDWQEYRVVGGFAPGLVLSDEEISWLRNTWAEATSRR